MATDVHGFQLIEKYDSNLDLRIHDYFHPASGLQLTFLPLPNRIRKYASFSIPYGSNFLKFKLADKIYEVPAGSAHYLEHCIFSRDDEGGLLTKMTKLGADANAYTTNTHTNFYFNCTKGFFEALSLYFKALMKPTILPERVEAERDIILAEYRMYLDDPDSCLYLDMLQALFTAHPQKLDICGDVEGIEAITADSLQTVVDNFYIPATTHITLAGNLPENEILAELAKWLQPFKVQEKPTIILPKEPLTVVRPVQTVYRDVGISSFLLGIKDPFTNVDNILSGREIAVRRLAGYLLSEIVLGDTSKIWQDLCAQDLINDSFTCQYICEEDFAYWILGGESHAPEQAVAKLKLIMRNLQHYMALGKIDLAKALPAQLKAWTGNFLEQLDYVERCGAANSRANLLSMDLIEYSHLAEKIDENIFSFFSYLSDENCYAEAYMHERRE